MILHNRQEKPHVVQLEIEVEKLESLFNNGELCVVDVRPLNRESKNSLWDLCLSSCAKRLQCRALFIEPPKPCSHKSIR